jgi:hypothetical protein
MTVTMGVDLAAQPAKTAVCLLAWPPKGGPKLLLLGRGKTEDGTRFTDEWISTTACGLRPEHSGEITKVGIDDPFGWPIPFLDALAAHRDGPTWPLQPGDSTVTLRYRETDRVVQSVTPSGRWPLSVSSDLLAVPAMRCATILADIAAKRDAEAVARDGAGLCCEVYPDPALRIWTADSKSSIGKDSYKGPDNSGIRVLLLEAILAELSILDPGGRLAMIEREDDYLDALICALVARAAELGLTQLPDDNQWDIAQIEGWIHLPKPPLSRLAG